jgi:glyoxylase-like metal-dependent hydrolase (beta-lactamase superfamily II)
MKPIKIVLVITLVFFMSVLVLYTIEEESVGQPNVVQLSKTLYRITFPYSLRTNTAVSMGKDGFLLVDPGFKQTVPQLRKALNKLGKGKIKYIINTHPHGDHRSGNIIAEPETMVLGMHDAKMMVKKGVFALGSGPLKGFTGQQFETYYILKFNGEEIRFIPTPGTHSASDWLIHFTGSGVVHMGDLLLSQSFPAVSRKIKEYFPILEKAIDVFPEKTVFISGHGKELTKQGVKDYLNMLYTTAKMVQAGKKAGKTIEQMKKERILKEYESYNTYLDWLTTDYWIEVVCKFL